jgi:hypothetical protein
LVVLATACHHPEPDAGLISEENVDRLLMRGPVADGSVGDYYLRNEHLLAIIQKPGRQFGMSPYGGNLIDFGDVEQRVDVLGESMPLIQLGLTANFQTVRVIDDGSAGGPAILEATGEDELWDFLNLESLTPLFRYETDEQGEPIGLLKFDPAADLPVEIRVRYILPPDSRELQVRYAVRNTSGDEIALRVGFGLDVRGEVETFTPGRGFADPGVNLSNIGELLSSRIDSPFVGYQADGFSVGLRSADFLDGQETPRLFVAVMGVVLVIPGQATVLDLLDRRAPFEIPAGKERGFGFDLYLGDDVGDVYEWAVADSSWPRLGGRVVDERTGEPVAGARVAVIDPEDGEVQNAFVTDAGGAFGGRMRPGRYHVAADDLSRPPDPGRVVQLGAGAPADVQIELESPGSVQVEVQSANDPDDPAFAFSPCRVALLGTVPARTGGVCGVTATCSDNEPFRHNRRWQLGPPTPYVEHLIRCNTEMAPDQPLAVAPGRYLAVTSRGPEYDYVEQLVDVAPGEAVLVTGELHRVVDSEHLVAADFHIHQVRSPDSVVPLEERTKSFATAALDFTATSDHDAVTDLRPVVDYLGLSSEVVTVPGVETSTNDLGHFNGFPIAPLEGVQLGGPPDWAGGRRRPTPEQLFERMRLRGARIVQVNHPRNLLSYFSTLDLIYDLESGTIVENPETAPPNEILMMPPGEPKWSPTFDAMEIYNGLEKSDADDVMRDWFNFLSMGFAPTGTAVSDSHGTYRPNAGEPRTYIAATVDKAPFLDVDEVLGNLRAGRAFGSSGPILRVTAVGAGTTASFGELVPAAGGNVEVWIEVETPVWYSVSTAEIFLTQTYVDDDGDSQELTLAPTLTTNLIASDVSRANGGLGRRYQASVTLDDDDLGWRDGWLVVRVRGPGSSQYPVALSAGGATIHPTGTSPETFVTYHHNREPFALGNPIFLDRNGNGRYDPPHPLQ